MINNTDEQIAASTELQDIQTATNESTNAQQQQDTTTPDATPVPTPMSATPMLPPEMANIDLTSNDGDGGGAPQDPAPIVMTDNENGDASSPSAAAVPKKTLWKRIKDVLQGVVKSLLFGGLDGIVATFVAVATIYSSNVTMFAVVIVGLAKLIGGAVSMGVGDYISTKAEVNLISKERKRETWEYEQNLQAEKEEMTELLNEKGLDMQQCEKLVDILSVNKEAFIKMMMVHELGLETEADGWAPLKNGIANFFAFLLFGLVPLIVYFIALIVDRARAVKLTGDAYNMEVNIVFGVCAGVTLVTLAILGCLKARITRENMLLSVFLTVLVGALACGVGFGVATLLEKVFNLKAD